MANSNLSNAFLILNTKLGIDRVTKIIKAKYKASRRLGKSVWGDTKDPFNTKNYQELYSQDQVFINELNSNFTFTKYENDGIRYNPNI